MAQVLGTGPVHVYLSFGGASSPSSYADGAYSGPIYYGTTRDGPDITEHISHYPVMNDLTGPALSIDDGYAGREDIITLVMTRWLESLDQSIEAYPRQAAGLVRGSTPLASIGSLVVSEGMTFRMWLVHAGAGRAANVAAGLASGRMYYECEVLGPNKPVRGNKENMMVRVFKAKNIVNVTAGTLQLFSEASADIALATAVPIS